MDCIRTRVIRTLLQGATLSAAVLSQTAAHAAVFHLYGSGTDVQFATQTSGTFFSSLSGFVNDTLVTRISTSLYRSDASGGISIRSNSGAQLSVDTFGPEVYNPLSGVAIASPGRYAVTGRSNGLPYTLDIYDTVDVSFGSNASWVMPGQPNPLPGTSASNYFQAGPYDLSDGGGIKPTFLSQAAGGGMVIGSTVGFGPQLYGGTAASPFIRVGNFLLKDCEVCTPDRVVTIQPHLATPLPPPPPAPPPSFSFQSISGLTLPPAGYDHGDYGSRDSRPQMAHPFPLEIAVSGLSKINDLNITLAGITAQYSFDLDFLLQAPNGAVAYLMSDAGGNRQWSGKSITFDQQSPNVLTDVNAGIDVTVRPAVNGYADNSITPFAENYGNSTLDVFNSLTAKEINGVWKLYAANRFGDVDGSLVSASLSIEGVALSGTPEPSSWAMLIVGFGFVGNACRRLKPQVARLRARMENSDPSLSSSS